jgi:hypothetical protein
MQKFASNDQEFEQAFSALAFERLQDKLRNIFKYLVGFEIVKKNEEGTKALGVFGFRGDSGQIVFVPVFFLNGEIRGVNLLYSKTNEQFYPLNEDFAQKLLSSPDTNPAEPSLEHKQELHQDVSRGNLRDLVVPPRTGKTTFASDREYDHVMGLARSINWGAAGKKALLKQSQTRDLLTFIRDVGNDARGVFNSFIEKDADFFEGVLRFYDMEKLASALVPDQEAKYRKDSDVEVVRFPEDSEKMKQLTLEQKQKGMEEGVLILDKRPDNKKSVFGLEQFPEKFSTATENGIATYLSAEGALRVGMVFPKMQSLQGSFVLDDTGVLCLEKSEAADVLFVANHKNVLIKDKHKVQDLTDFLNMLKDPAEMKPGYENIYMLVNEKLKVSAPFRVKANFKENDGMRRISAEPVSIYGDSEDPDAVVSQLKGPIDNPTSMHSKPRANSYKPDRKLGEVVLVLSKKVGDQFTYLSGEMTVVPKGFKVLELSRVVPANKNIDNCCNRFDPVQNKESKKEVLTIKQCAPGGRLALTGMMTTNHIYPMTVRSNGSEYYVDIASVKKRYDSDVQAKIAMVVDFGLPVETASKLVKLASQKKKIKGTIKFANTGDQILPLYEPPVYTNVNGLPETSDFSYEYSAPPTEAYLEDPTRLGLGERPDYAMTGAPVQADPTEDVKRAIQMSELGQKQIFDTQAIATLAKYVRPSQKIKAYLPDLLTGIDRLGRLLFMAYWETDKFEEAFGESDLPEFVELLTEAINNLGDIVIFLDRRVPEISINSSKKDSLGV